MATADRRLLIIIKKPLLPEDWEAIHEIHESSTDVDIFEIAHMMKAIGANKRRFAFGLLLFPIKIVFNLLAGNYYPCLAEHQFMLRYCMSPVKKLTEKAYAELYMRESIGWLDGP